jgi:hypothetical protein
MQVAKQMVHPAQAELGLGPDRRDVLDGGERLLALGHVRQVGVQERQVELDVQRLLVELAAQVEAGLGRVHVAVEVEHHVVGHDRVAGGEERHQAVDEVPLGGVELAGQVQQVVGEVDLVHGPGVADGIPVQVVEGRVPHRSQGEVESGVEQAGAAAGGARRAGGGLVPGEVLGDRHSQASQCSGSSSEQATASAALTPTGVVAVVMRVAGRERR